MLRVIMLRRGGFCRDLERNFSHFPRPQNFSSEIARDRAEIHADCLCAASPRAAEVPMHNAERRHAVASEIACDCRSISDRNFQIFSRPHFRPKSREIVPKSMPIAGARPRNGPQRSPCTMLSVGMLWRGGFCRDLDRNFSKFSAAAKFYVRNRARSCRNRCRVVVRGLATSRRGPHAQCKASACCGK